MTKGDRVRYTERHDRYLDDLYSTARKRHHRGRTGSVVGRHDVGRAKLVHVIWDYDPLVVRTHFAENLQVVSASSNA